MSPTLLSFIILLIAWAIMIHLYVDQLKKLRLAERLFFEAREAVKEARRVVFGLSKENQDLRMTIKECRDMIRFLERKVRYSPSKKVPSPLSKGEITSLLKLCHPDKHGNTAESNKVTTKLIQLRKSL